MNKSSWQEIFAEMAGTLKLNAAVHPELKPLLTAFVNFDHKYRVHALPEKANRQRRRAVCIMPGANP